MGGRLPWAWCLYDWANSAFALVCMTALFPAVLVATVDRQLGSPMGATVWAWLAGAGLAASVAVSPFLGAWADGARRRKAGLAFLVLLGSVCCLFMGIFLPRSWVVAGLAYVLGASAFALGNVLYDALLLSVAPPGEWDRWSARGYAAGYLGGALALVGSLLFWQRGAQPWAFAWVGGWWLVFSLPLFFWVPEPAGSSESRARVSFLWAKVRKNQRAVAFLLAYWLYNDGIGTVIKMAGAYGSTLGIPLTHLAGALLLAQAVGVPGTLLLARLAGRVGQKKAILAALAVYLLVALWALGLEEAWEFWVLAGLVGLVQGGAQALSRSLYARFVPPGAEASYFAFYDVSGRMAGLAGPALFAVATQLGGTAAAGVAVTALFFLAGGALLWRVEGP